MASNFDKMYKEKKNNEEANVQSEVLSYSKMDKMISGEKLQNHNVSKKYIKKITHKVFSFWAQREIIAEWQAYIKLNPEIGTVEDLGTAAINEYIQNHPLPEERVPMFESFKNEELKKAMEEKEEAIKKYSK